MTLLWLALGDYRGPALARAFVGYLVARYTDRLTEKSFRVYVTDSLQSIPQMQYKTKRWAELAGIVDPEKERSAEEIVDDVVARLGM
jgi:hypothetical protein